MIVQNQIRNLNMEELLLAFRLVDSVHMQSDIKRLGEYLNLSSLRIGIFAPFNHGKSTLLNALLGSKALPIGLVPTTGAAIVIKYGDPLRTCIRTTDGRKICELGTDILHRFTVLDDNRCMRGDISSVEVFCPYPLLKMGVEMVDLPGTDDMEAQDDLIYHELLTIDLVIQVLDARKLFTLSESNKLQDWLISRGIKTSIFVLNFMNLLDKKEQIEVADRAKNLAKGFRASLSSDTRNLYRVDALPALRSRIKEDLSLSKQSGLILFESGLTQISKSLLSQLEEIRLLRMLPLVKQAYTEIDRKSYAISSQITIFDATEKVKSNQLNSDLSLFKKSFKLSISAFKEWCHLPNILGRYKTAAVPELKKGNFYDWKIKVLQENLNKYQYDIMKYVYQACELSGHSRPVPLAISLPPDPNISIPPAPSISEPTNKSVAAVAGFGWLVGGPLGAAVGTGIAYAAKKYAEKNNAITIEQYANEVDAICLLEIANYFKLLNDKAVEEVDNLVKECEHLFAAQPSSEPTHITEMREQLSKMLAASECMERWLALDCEHPKQT